MLALVIPAFALGAAACGGAGATKTTSPGQQAAHEAHWRAGLLRWHRATQHALDGVSMLFATDGTISELHLLHSRASMSLASFEVVLVRCSATVRGLGPVPAAFATAGRYALRACRSFELGAVAMDGVVARIRDGGELDTLDPLSSAGDLLSTGQSDLTTAVRALAVSPT